MLKVSGRKSCLPAIALLLLAVQAFAQSQSSQNSVADVDWSKAERVTVAMRDYEFTPDRVTFHLGVPTRLHLDNASGSIHDFTAADFFRAADLRDPGVIGASGIGVTVEPHQQRDVDFIPRLRGHFGLTCADHDWAGMKADIFVE